MTWLLVLNLVGLVLAVLLVLETFRPRPMWPRIEKEKSASPRQRRWLGFALLLIMSGGMVNWLSMADVVNLALLGFALPVLGLVVLIVSLAKGPTDEEVERRKRTLSREGN